MVRKNNHGSAPWELGAVKLIASEKIAKRKNKHSILTNEKKPVSIQQVFVWRWGYLLWNKNKASEREQKSANNHRR